MKILFIGSRLEALTILELYIKSNDFESPVIFTGRDSMIHKHKIEKQLLLYNRNNKKETLNELSKLLKKYNFDIVLSVGFNFLISKEILETNHKTIFLNSHPHLLPKWKGNNAIKQSILKGETEFGCTVHYIDEKMDNGQIIIQEKIKVLKNEQNLIYKYLFEFIEPIAIHNALKLINNGQND